MGYMVLLVHETSEGIMFLLLPKKDGSQTEADQVDQGAAVAPTSGSRGEGPEAERTPRPLSPTKLLPFLSHMHRLQSDAELEALRKRLHHAPRPLKKRSSITEPEGPAGPNIQKLLYQKTTLAAMETGEEAEGRARGGAPNDLPIGRDSQTEPREPWTNLRKAGSERIKHGMRVRFNPLALLLDSSLEGEYDLVQRIIYEVEDPSMPNDEGITALHNAVCAGHTEIVKFLVQFGVNVNAADSDGWTPLHCAASCNSVQVCKFLVECGAAVFATTHSDMQTAADKCEELEEGYAQCSQFLYGVQEKMGVMNRGVVYALWDYEAESADELSFREGDCMTVLRREDGEETEWWWARCGDNEGYIPRNLLGDFPQFSPQTNVP
uniref:SH3 domain-containing protein n=1 Tax=Electrophorus electricus TaxID=8005 RepID=A0A4W4H8Z5_ELEEL